MRAIEMIEAQAIRDGLVTRSSSTISESSKIPDETNAPESENRTKPWQQVTDHDVAQAINGTLLGRLCDLLASVTEPDLPLAITLPKALALCGCALSQARELNPIEGATAPWGISRARFRIDTAGGQACNIWSLIVAPSGTGKDIGNMPDAIVRAHQLCIGSSGSAEGLADALKERGAGMLTIGEFGPFLDKTAWQSKAAFFLTDAWSRGWFQVNLSQRSSDIRRESAFCYPSVIANIQPHTLRMFYNEIQLGSGFLARFLLSYCGNMILLRPRPGGLAGMEAAQQIFNRFLKVAGHVEPPSNYLGDVVDEFNKHGARYPHIFGRLVNEYGPRFAVMLAVDGSDGPPVLTDDIWRRAGVLVRWFFAQAERLFDDLSGTEYERRREARLESFFEFIRRKGNCTLTQIAHQYSKNTNKEERKEILDELHDRGRINVVTEGGRQIIRAVC